MINLELMQNALIHKFKEYDFSCGETVDSLVWLNDKRPKPTEIEIQQAIDEYVIYKQSILYLEKREKEYPKLQELIMALWEKVVENNSGSADTLQALRISIKEKYPSPT